MENEKYNDFKIVDDKTASIMEASYSAMLKALEKQGWGKCAPVQSLEDFENSAKPNGENSASSRSGARASDAQLTTDFLLTQILAEVKAIRILLDRNRRVRLS